MTRMRHRASCLPSRTKSYGAGSSQFLAEVIPVAEQAGVRLALHPDDPPMPTMRRQPRLVHQPYMYERVLEAFPSDSNALELCVGTLAEMTRGRCIRCG